MADGTRKPVFWPVVFIGAFGVGALLWALWMVWAVEKTKRVRPDDFYAPGTRAAANATGNGTNGTDRTNSTNGVAVGTNR